jgi:stage V sporulation protein B
MFKALVQNSGTEKEQIDVIWGVYSGKYKLLCNVPIALASAMASSTIPNISRNLGNRKTVRRNVGDVIRFTMVISIPCAVGLGVFGKEIMEVLWPGTPEIGAEMMWFGSSAVVFYSLSTLTNGILQGIDKMRLPVIHAAVSLGLHVILLYVLIAVFHMDGMAIVWSYVFFGAVMCVLNNLAIRKHLKYQQEIWRTFIIPVIVSAVMGIVSRLLYDALFKVLGENGLAMLVSLAVAVIFAIAIYFAGLLLMKGLKERELRAFPKGHVLVKIAKKLHLL